MSDALESLHYATCYNQKLPRLLGVFAAWRLQAYGYALAALYALLLLRLYSVGAWLVDSSGLPIYTDFTCEWVAAWLALNGQTGSLFDPAEFEKIQATLVGPSSAFYPIWEYPPTFLLALAPFAILPYTAAFLSWGVITLLGCLIAVYFIVQRPPAIALVLASPFALLNFFSGQNGFLTASLFGASLLFLERHPVVSGMFIGCLTYKPQFGILFPVALAASKQWRAMVSAAVTAVLLAGASIAVFGTAVWEAFPRNLLTQANDALLADPGIDPRLYFGLIQTVYGFVRYLNGSANLAWIVQGATTCGIAAMVWLVWRSRVRYPMKAAILSAAAFIATPYAHAYDLAAIAIPVAFLASDQLRSGLLRGEQTIAIALFGASLLVLATYGRTPIGPFVIVLLLWVTLRRIRYHRPEPAIFA
jgi:arabinofuranan 3-O-arabinosyltransferase